MAKTADEIRKEIERINASKKSSNTSSASASNASTSKTKTKADAIQERLDELNSRTPQQQQRSQFWNYGLFGLAPYIGEGTYRTDPTGNTEKFYGYGGGITELTPDSVQDQAAKQLTGHKTALTDYGANVPIGTVANRIANYRSTLATAGLALGGLFHGDNHYEPEQGSTLWKMLQASSASSRQANDILQAAKEGRGWVGSTIADVESSAIDVAIDSIYSMMGGSSMAPMTVRSFGSASQQARDEGKSISTQLITGAKSAAIEYFTEKMWGIGGRKIEGGGYIEALTKRWGNNLIERGVPAIVEKMAAAFGSEAVEEMMSDVLNALFDKGFASISQRLGGDYEYSGFPELTEILHDGLVGGLVGLGGGTSEGISAQRSINQNGKSSWIRAQREANQINADQSAMEKFKKKLTTKKGKAEFGPLFKRSIARHFAAERGITAANEVANDFFKAYNQVKAEEFENPEKALEKIIEKYNEIRVEKDIKPNAKPRAEGARPIGYGYSEEQINQFKQGVEPEQQAAAPQPQADENRGNGMPEQGKPNYDRNHSIDSIAEAWDGSRSATEFLGKLGYSSEEINQLIDESDSVFDLVQKLGLSNDDIDFLTDYLELGDDYESVSVSEWLKNKYARSQNLETVEKAYVETSSGMEFLKALGYSEAEATEILSKVSVQNPLGDIFKMIGMRESQINSFMEDLESVDEDQERPSSGEWLKKGLSNETVRDNDSGRVQNEAKVGREESENGGVRQDNGQTLNEESRSNERSSEQAQRQSAEAEEQRKPSNRIYSQKQLDKLRSSDAVGENINRRHGEIASGEVNQEKSSARLGYARQIAQKANVDEATLDHILDGMLLRGWRDVYDYIANGQIESSGMDADEFNDYYRGLAAQQLLMDISEGNLPSVLDDLKTLGVDEKTAKDYLAKMRDALKADGMYNESNEARSAEADKKYNPYATVSATTADNKGKNNLTSTIGEMNADIGDAQTVGFERAKFEQQANDTLIREFTMKKQRGSGKNRLFNNEKHKLRLYQRGESTFILVNEDGRIVGTYDEIEKAYVAAKGTGDQYQEVRIKLGSGAFGEFVHGQYRRVGVDFGKVFTQENYEKSQNGDDKNAAVRFITRIRSHASHLADVNYDTWTDAKTTTDMLTIDLSGVDNMYSITNLLKQIIDLSSEGKGIQGSNGKTYIFAGQSASQRKNGTIQLMEKSAYEAVRDTMRGYAVKDGDVDKFNPAKYLANVGFMFTPSNNDTGVKLADCVVLPDVYEMRFNVLNWYMVTDIAKDEAELTSRFKKSYEALKNKDGSAKYTKEQAAELAAQKAKGYLANAKVGFPIEILTDVVMANSTDGTGFIWSDKRESFQMRSVGGVKGLLQSMDFYKYLQDNLPAGDQATPPDTAQYFYKTSDGEVWAKTVWGNWVNLRGKKALLFNSTVKFADKFTIKNGDVVDGEASY